MIKLVAFDLDGTLLNTLDDITDSCNYTLDKFGYPKRTKQEVRRVLGYGVVNLLERILPQGVALSEEKFEDFKSTYAAHYKNNQNNKTKPYNGIIDILSVLKDKGVKLAVLSNKAHNNTVDIVNYYFPNIMEIVLGERAGVPIKPDPQSLFEVMKICRTSETETVYVGDSETDIKVALASGVRAVAVTWGFRDKEELEKIGTQKNANTCSELLEYIFE